MKNTLAITNTHTINAYFVPIFFMMPDEQNNKWENDTIFGIISELNKNQQMDN